MRKIKLPIQGNITTEIIDYVISTHSQEKARIDKLKENYDNHNDILNRTMKDSTKPNNRLSHPYCAFITNMAVGHAFGVPIAYNSDEEELKSKIQEISDYNDEADHNNSLATWQSICGYGVELIYSDEDAFVRYNAINPSEIAIVYDLSITENIQFAIRYFDIPVIGDEKPRQQIEVYTSDSIIVYEKQEDKYKEMTDETRSHEFGQVPISIYPNNNDYVGDFEKVIGLINGYDKAQSDTSNDFEYFTDAYLLITGATLDGSEAQELKEKRVINLPDSDGKAEFLIKQLNDTALENFKNRLDRDIHKFSFIPDITSEGFTASISGEALKFKFAALNNICKTKQSKFKKGLMRRIELICTFLGKLDATQYTSIVPIFTLNMPKNESDIANMMKNLTGIVSQETLLGWHPGVEDPAYEIEKVEKEKSGIIDDYPELDTKKVDDDNG